MHPILRDGTELGTIIHEADPVGKRYYAYNPDGKKYEISQEIFDALLKADGTKPMDLPNEIITALKKCKLIQTARFVKTADSIYNRFILFPIGSGANKYRKICILLNRLLPITAFSIFAVAVWLKLQSTSITNFDLNAWVCFSLFSLSVLLHEVGHLIAGLAYDFNIRELGVQLLGVLPVGAYIAHEDKSNVPKKNLLQFALAGIEINLLLTGVFLLLSMAYYPLSQTFITLAIINLNLVVINSLPARGLDGEAVLCAIWGIGEQADKYEQIV